MAQPSRRPAGLDPNQTVRVEIPLTEKPGDRIGRYRLLQQIGEGGCGVVYMAEQEEPVRRRVALKVIKLGMDTKSVIARFEAERQALALMDHPNIAKVFDAGATDTGRPYFVMELVRGVRITDYCDQNNLSTEDRLKLFTQVCHAIQHAHQKGIIHRDIKPSNILVTISEPGATGCPKVIDFGIAKATNDQRLTDKTIFTAFEQFIGTPAYMSPEQAMMTSLDVDTRTDIYALGVLLYELLTGRTPFDAKELMAGGLDAMRRIIREQEPARPSTRLSTLLVADLTTVARHRQAEPARLGTLLRGDLDWIVMKALEKERSRRYETASGLAADVQRHLSNEPVVARPPSAGYRFQKLIRRNKLAFAAIGAVAGTLLFGIVVSAWQAIRATHAQKAETRQRLVAEGAKAQAQTKQREAEAERARAETERQRAQEKAELLAREDYVSRVNRAYREVQDDNIALAEDLLHGCPIERRGWEWHFVKRLGNSERQVIDFGITSVNALAFSPGGDWAVSGSGDRIVGGAVGGAVTISIWDVGSGQRRKSLPGAKGILYDVAVSPDSKKVAAGCSKGLLLVSDVETEQVAWTRMEPGLNTMAVAFSPDGKSLAAGYGLYSHLGQGRVKVWDAATGQETRAFTGPRGGVNKVAFHPDGKRLAIAGSGVVEVWDFDAARKLLELKGHKKWVYCLAYSPDGQWLATGGWDGTVMLREAATGREVLTIFAHEGFVLNSAFSPDSRTLVTTSEDRSVRLWDVASGRRLATFHGHADFVQAVAFRPDGGEVATGGMDGSVRFWDLKTSRPVVIEHSSWVVNLAFRRDGLRVLSANTTVFNEPVVTRGWNPLTGDIDPALAGNSFEALPVGFVLSSGLVRSSGLETRPVTSPDGKLIAEPSAFAGAGLAARSKDSSISTVIIRDTASGQLRQILAGHSADVVAQAFSPDGHRLATASFDRTVKLWDVRTGQEVLTLRGHTAGAVSVCFSPDGNKIVSGGIDATARVWDATPFAPSTIAEDDARYQRKAEALARLKTRANDLQPPWSGRSEKASNLSKKGDAFQQQGETKQATAAYAEATEIYTSLALEFPNEPAYRNELISLLAKTGRLAETEVAMRETLAMQRKLLGDEHSEVAALQFKLGRLLRDQGKLAEAEPLFREAILSLDQLARKNPESSDYRVRRGHSQWQLGQLLGATNRLEEAEQVFREALQVFEQAARDFPAERFFRQEQAATQRLLAVVATNRKQTETAERRYHAAIELYTALLAEAPADSIYMKERNHAVAALVSLYEATGQPDKAAEWNKQLAEFDQAEAKKQVATPKPQSPSQP